MQCQIILSLIDYVQVPYTVDDTRTLFTIDPVAKFTRLLSKVQHRRPPSDGYALHYITLRLFIVVKVKCAVLLLECRRGAHLPS